MADGLSQIAIEKLDKNNFQVWKFRIMNFLMGKGYWEFITSDDTEPPLPENPTQQQIQANKCRNPNLVKCGDEAQHLEKWGFGVLRDS
jgi:hypothetical protein